MNNSIEVYLDRLNKRIKEFSGTFMSNSKWQKLFLVLSRNLDTVKNCRIKTVGDTRLREFEIPNPNNFSEAFHPEGINDIGISGPFFFKEIEQMIFPKFWSIKRSMGNESLEPFNYHQDIIRIKELIEETGKFELEIDDSELILYGYKY